MISIRRYRLSDAKAVWDLHLAGLDETGANVGEGPWDQDLHDVERVYLMNAGEFLIGTVDEQVVAMGALRKISPDRAEIKRMRVKPDYRRRGFGESILAALEDRAIHLGYRDLCLDTTGQQVPAQRMYEKHGFRLVRSGQFRGMEILFYEKRLSDNRDT